MDESTTLCLDDEEGETFMEISLTEEMFVISIVEQSERGVLGPRDTEQAITVRRDALIAALKAIGVELAPHPA